MQPYKTARKLTFVSFFAGIVCLTFVLFLQPSEPSGFLVAALDFSRNTRLPALNAPSVFAFWGAVTMLTLSLFGFLSSAFLKRRQRSRNRKEASAQYDYADKGEENWMFI
ncbi:MAG: hypothetical protein ACO1NO_07845 [Burkholderiaceae bacterium]